MAIFHTCTSTGNSGLSRQNISTQDMVFGPTPLNLERYSLTLSLVWDLRCSREHSPLSSRTAFRML